MMVVKSKIRSLWSMAALGLLLPVLPAQGVENDVGAWFVFTGVGRFEPKSEDTRWRWWFDGQIRLTENSDGFNQSIMRPGLGYDVAKNTTAWLGYGWFSNDPALGEPFDEHRVWQQLTWKMKLGSTTLSSRTRLEQRFVETGSDTGWRFRQFVRITPPHAANSGIGLRIWEELFVDLNDTDWGAKTGFRQNRLFVGLGLHLDQDKRFLFELGYLNQYLRRSSSRDSMNHLLFAQLIFKL